MTKVTATKSTGERKTTLTDRGGEYEFVLSKGSYELKFKRKGFKWTIFQRVNVTGREQFLDVKMEIGVCSDCEDASPAEDKLDDYGVLTGTVYAPDGAVITNAKLRFRGVDGFEKTKTTNDAGNYEMIVFPGNYSIEVQSEGFQTFRLEKYRIGKSFRGKMNLDVELEIGPCIGCHSYEVPNSKIKKRKHN